MGLVDSINQFISFIPDNQKIRLSKAFNNISNRKIYGSLYRAEYDQLLNNEKRNRGEIELSQFRQFKAVLRHAYNHSSFYKGLYDSYDIKPDDIKSLADISCLPMIDKTIVRNSINDIYLSNAPIYLKSKTGGTTSSPMVFPESIASKIKERAYMTRYHRWHGIDESDLKITLKGVYMSANTDWFYNPFLKSFVFPIFDVSPEIISNYFDVIEKIKPKAITFSYPSVVYMVAQFINRGLIERPRSIAKIFCSSETLFSYQIDEIQKAFKTRPVDHYGQNERVSLIQQCHSYQYHIIPEYGYTEIIDENGRRLSDEGAIGEIVGTSFLNNAFPLIRYRTGDIAIVGSKESCQCGLPYPRVKSIQGRHGDMIKLKSGACLLPTAVEFITDKINHINDIQLRQSNYEQLEVLLVPDDNFEPKDKLQIVDELSEATKHELKINVSVVDKIERPKNMKKRFVVSQL